MQEENDVCFDKRQVARLERKIDDLEKTVNKIDNTVSAISSVLIEREKSEILRNQVLSEAMKVHQSSIESAHVRVDKIEEINSKIITTLVGVAVSLILLGVSVLVSKVG